MTAFVNGDKSQYMNQSSEFYSYKQGEESSIDIQLKMHEHKRKTKKSISEFTHLEN